MNREEPLALQNSAASFIAPAQVSFFAEVAVNNTKLLKSSKNFHTSTYGEVLLSRSSKNAQERNAHTFFCDVITLGCRTMLEVASSRSFLSFRYR